jgi:hypothetical protein
MKIGQEQFYITEEILTDAFSSHNNIDEIKKSLDRYRIVNIALTKKWLLERNELPSSDELFIMYMFHKHNENILK